jgi:hypothetical protein
LILASGDDQFVPKTVDQKKNVERWMSSCAAGVASPLSGLVPGARHAVESKEAQGWLNDRVVKFLGNLEKPDAVFGPRDAISGKI